MQGQSLWIWKRNGWIGYVLKWRQTVSWSGKGGMIAFLVIVSAFDLVFAYEAISNAYKHLGNHQKMNQKKKTKLEWKLNLKKKEKIMDHQIARKIQKKMIWILLIR